MKWEPATVGDMKKIIQNDLAECDDEQVAVFERYAVEPYLARLL
jgi:hypothetical protein